MLFSSWLRNRNRPASAARRRILGEALAALALLLLALVAPVGVDAGEPPDLGDCQILQVPPGNEVAFHVYAEGVQIYRWNGTRWVFSRPEAVLYADAGENGAVGIHYAGPTWESVSGSIVVGQVRQRCTPDPDCIPWLLLGAVHTEGPGIFHDVTYIQRLYTVGGKAPTSPGDYVGEEVRVPYSAEYFFYRADA